VQQVTLGDFNGELPYQVYPMQLDGNKSGEFWLPMYFANWTGRSMVLPDKDAAEIYQTTGNVKADPVDLAKDTGTGVTGPAKNQLNEKYTPGTIATALRYGKQYDFRVRMRDWAALDVAAAIDHMRTVWPKLPLAVVGHSFGGQAVGLAPNNGEISRALLVAAQAGYWRLFHSPEKYRVYLMLRLIGSPVARLVGYMPGRLGIGEDLPRDVFLEWTGWVMRPRYFFDDATLDALAHFPRYRGALRAICLTDDPWATAPAVDLLCSGFSGTRPERIDVRPADAGVAKIGHFGFFRPEHRDTLWRDAAQWLAGSGETRRE